MRLLWWAFRLASALCSCCERGCFMSGAPAAAGGGASGRGSQQSSPTPSGSTTAGAHLSMGSSFSPTNPFFQAPAQPTASVTAHHAGDGAGRSGVNSLAPSAPPAFMASPQHAAPASSLTASVAQSQPSLVTTGRGAAAVGPSPLHGTSLPRLPRSSRPSRSGAHSLNDWRALFLGRQ